jgi:hypothetical protein
MAVFTILSGRSPAIHLRQAETLDEAAWEARQCASRGEAAAVVIRHGDGRDPRPVFAIWADGNRSRDYRESKTPKVGAVVLSYIRGRGGLPT